MLAFRARPPGWARCAALARGPQPDRTAHLRLASGASAAGAPAVSFRLEPGSARLRWHFGHNGQCWHCCTSGNAVNAGISGTMCQWLQCWHFGHNGQLTSLSAFRAFLAVRLLPEAGIAGFAGSGNAALLVQGPAAASFDALRCGDHDSHPALHVPRGGARSRWGQAGRTSKGVDLGLLVWSCLERRCYGQITSAGISCNAASCWHFGFCRSLWHGCYSPWGTASSRPSSTRPSKTSSCADHRTGIGSTWGPWPMAAASGGAA